MQPILQCNTQELSAELSRRFDETRAVGENSPPIRKTCHTRAELVARYCGEGNTVTKTKTSGVVVVYNKLVARGLGKQGGKKLITVHEVWSIPAASSLVNVDNVADVLVLVVSGVDGLGDVPGHGRVIEVFVDVVHDAVGHALEEIGHVGVPGGLPVKFKQWQH